MYFYNVLFFSAPEVIPGDNRHRGFTEVARRLRETACRGGVAASTTDHRTFGLLIADHLVKPSSMANHLVRCRRRLAEGHAPSEASENRGVEGTEQGEEVVTTNVEVQIEGIKCVH
ncbi:unnamed protein product [Callosobruchus maculatus]|uniref:Uncharacterized protein n=1 Tax=Callosobruchus maculatus TaxID=64391 RepID=A0A653DF74_CALMS|nr:unnamed protein product [Callosobruchus maculatus]